MFFKMAINNVKRSFKDYSIYFLTLTFAVCIFYSFNSIEAQNVMFEMGKSMANYMSTLNKLIAGTSVFVSFVLAILITYANNFLIRKRKKELGIYMTLGMSKGKISKILIFETMLIGLISLAAGILLGIIVSQGLSVIAANILGVDVNKYKFIISVSAVLKSTIYFGIIFVLVMVLNQITISKYKLIDMLNAAKKNEEVKLKNIFVSILIFLLSIIILSIAYTLIINLGIQSDSILVFVSIIMGIIGTMLFFFSLSNFFIHVMQKRKKVYLKDLNIFVLRQIHNKINTNFLSMSMICLMLFLTITLLFTMFGYKRINDRLLEGNTSFDASSWLIANDKEQKIDGIEEYLERIDFKFKSNEKHAFFSEYKLNVTIGSLLSDYLNEQEKLDFRNNYMDGQISALRISEYNEIIQLKGQEPIDLKDNEVLVVSNYEKMNQGLDKFMKSERLIKIEDKTYNIRNYVPIKENVITTGSSSIFFYLIIPDNFTGELQLDITGFNVVFDDNYKDISEQRFLNLFNDYENKRYIDNSSVLVFGNTIDQVHARIYGTTATIVFIGIYLGIVFLISSAAVLALQQLSDASDSLERYKALRKIGATENIINKAILIQILIYFMLPLALAIIHSIVGINVVNELFRSFDQSIIGRSLILIAVALFIIYGGYFYATYVGFKNIIKNSN
jgi:putative ABC transport system permease protein